MKTTHTTLLKSAVAGTMAIGIVVGLGSQATMSVAAPRSASTTTSQAGKAFAYPTRVEVINESNGPIRVHLMNSSYTCGSANLNKGQSTSCIGSTPAGNLPDIRGFIEWHVWVQMKFWADNPSIGWPRVGVDGDTSGEGFSEGQWIDKHYRGHEIAIHRGDDFDNGTKNFQLFVRS